MLHWNFSLNLQGIERDLKQIRLENMKESELPEQHYRAKVINILSLGFVLRSQRGGLPVGLSLPLFCGIALVCNVTLLVFSICNLKQGVTMSGFLLDCRTKIFFLAFF